MVCCDISQAVVGCDQDKALHGPQTCEVYCHAASQAASNNDDVFMFSMHSVKECQGSCNDGLLGRAAGTSTIARVCFRTPGVAE